jgi:malate synthase
MEDAATAEISRAQVWQWIRYSARLSDGRFVTAAMVREVLEQQCVRLASQIPARELFLARPAL